MAAAQNIKAFSVMVSGFLDQIQKGLNKEWEDIVASGQPPTISDLARYVSMAVDSKSPWVGEGESKVPQLILKSRAPAKPAQKAVKVAAPKADKSDGSGSGSGGKKTMATYNCPKIKDKKTGRDVCGDAASENRLFADTDGNQHPLCAGCWKVCRSIGKNGVEGVHKILAPTEFGPLVLRKDGTEVESPFPKVGAVEPAKVDVVKASEPVKAVDKTDKKAIPFTADSEDGSENSEDVIPAVVAKKPLAKK
jgi:hypothetical protein